jgi:hypothetical protein
MFGPFSSCSGVAPTAGACQRKSPPPRRLAMPQAAVVGDRGGVETGKAAQPDQPAARPQRRSTLFIGQEQGRLDPAQQKDRAPGTVARSVPQPRAHALAVVHRPDPAADLTGFHACPVDRIGRADPAADCSDLESDPCFLSRRLQPWPGSTGRRRSRNRTPPHQMQSPFRLNHSCCSSR